MCAVASLCDISRARLSRLPMDGVLELLHLRSGLMVFGSLLPWWACAIRRNLLSDYDAILVLLKLIRSSSWIATQRAGMLICCYIVEFGIIAIAYICTAVVVRVATFGAISYPAAHYKLYVYIDYKLMHSTCICFRREFSLAPLLLYLFRGRLCRTYTPLFLYVLRWVKKLRYLLYTLTLP